MKKKKKRETFIFPSEYSVKKKKEVPKYKNEAGTATSIIISPLPTQKKTQPTYFKQNSWL